MLQSFKNSKLICTVSQLNSPYMVATLALNGWNKVIYRSNAGNTMLLIDNSSFLFNRNNFWNSCIMFMLTIGNCSLEEDPRPLYFLVWNKIGFIISKQNTDTLLTRKYFIVRKHFIFCYDINNAIISGFLCCICC